MPLFTSRCSNNVPDLISGIVLAHPLSGSNNFGTGAQCLTAALAVTVHIYGSLHQKMWGA